jgi:hypothetical protein
MKGWLCRRVWCGGESYEDVRDRSVGGFGWGTGVERIDEIPVSVDGVTLLSFPVLSICFHLGPFDNSVLIQCLIYFWVSIYFKFRKLNYFFVIAVQLELAKTTNGHVGPKELKRRTSN